VYNSIEWSLAVKKEEFKMQKVLIVNPINSLFDSIRPPFGLLTITSKFLELGVETVWLDADVMRDVKKLHASVKKHLDADLIALGGMHTAYPFYKEFFRFLETSKINIPTIIGGRIAKDYGDTCWKKFPNLTMLCRQEGEAVIHDRFNNCFSFLPT
jgi:hypothetical protein